MNPAALTLTHATGTTPIFIGPGVLRDLPAILAGIQPPLPVFAAKTLSGSMVDSKEIYKYKPAVVVIFSPKCSHCQDELTFLNSLYTSGDLKEQFEVVAISILDQQTTADFINKQKYAFPVIADADKKLCSLFPSYTGSIPCSALLLTGPAP